MRAAASSRRRSPAGSSKNLREAVVDLAGEPGDLPRVGEVDAAGFGEAVDLVVEAGRVGGLAALQSVDHRPAAGRRARRRRAPAAC